MICSLESLLEFIGNQGRTCSCQCNGNNWMLIGSEKCIRGHIFSWASLQTVANVKKSTLHIANLVFVSSVLISGTNFYKIL